MKKIMTVAAAVAMTAMTMVSCDGDNKADLKDGVVGKNDSPCPG